MKHPQAIAVLRSALQKLWGSKKVNPETIDEVIQMARTLNEHKKLGTLESKAIVDTPLQWRSLDRDTPAVGLYKKDEPSVGFNPRGKERLFGALLHEPAHYLTSGPHKSAKATYDKYATNLYRDIAGFLPTKSGRERRVRDLARTLAGNWKPSDKLVTWAAHPWEMIANNLEMQSMYELRKDPSNWQKFFGQVMPEEIVSRNRSDLEDLVELLIKPTKGLSD